jgi:glycosyltransferase involved in cell wall biosynthesis
LQRRAKPNIEFLGWVDDVRLAELYANCQALIFPGEEDFGIVPLEAQASGRPVIAFNRGGLLETVVGLDGPSPAGPPTGLFFSEQRTESLAAAVELYQRRRDEFLPDKIRQHAGKFSRERFKQKIAEAIGVCVNHFHRRVTG